MTQAATAQPFGVLTEPATLTIERLLPGSVDRLWAYLTESELRRQWMASGVMDMRVGGKVELVWRNDELSRRGGAKPPEFGDEHRLESEITELDPPRRLGITWGSTGGVTFDLEPVGDMVRLTVTHRRIPDRDMQLNISAGWHAHLDVLAARLAGEEPEPFWDHWVAPQAQHAERL